MISEDIFHFDDVRVDVADQTVVRAGIALKMPPRIFQTLVILAQAAPRMVAKAELFEALWPDTVVDESALAQNIYLLRRVLGTRPEGGEYIETVPKRGYRLAATVIREAVPARPVESSAKLFPWRAIVLAGALVLAIATAAILLRPRVTRQAPDPEAVRLVKMAEEVWKNTLIATPAAGLQLRQAIQIDPGYAPGYVALAVLEATGNSGEAERLISRALQLDPNSADAHAVEGFVAMIHHWDWDRARTEFERAIALDPRNTEARRWYSMYFSFRGEHTAAAREIQAALELEPGSASLLMQHCSQLAYEDNFDAALASCQAALEVQPRFHWAHARMFQIYGILGKPELAAKHWILALDPTNLDSVESSAPQLELAARSKGMAGVLNNNLRAATAYSRAEAEGMLHERAATLQDLRQAVEHHEFFSAFIRAEPMFHFLYGDAEFDDLLRRVGLPATGASKS